MPPRMPTPAEGPPRRRGGGRAPRLIDLLGKVWEKENRCAVPHGNATFPGDGLGRASRVIVTIAPFSSNGRRTDARVLLPLGERVMHIAGRVAPRIGGRRMSARMAAKE